ncbi:unnamed protein product [Schistosoma rodhaini]|uniref:Endoplasmic reticulum junction formation protein lunapark n=1 Tax=Schistosoma rodhaini TaxID=6188 RepID=A0AA85FQ65_9TREM|nr:unnamed protein product [Schistosoma rodhaini]
MSWAKKYLFWIFKGSKKSIVDRLEDIDDEILELESDRSSSIDSEKQFVFRLLFYSFIFFGLSFITVYYYYWPRTVTGKVVICMIFAVYPFCIYFLKYIFRMMFTRRVNKTNEKLKRLRADKQKLLEEVMEKETFNKAQQILKRFDPLTFASITVEDKKVPKPVFGSMINLGTPHSEVRRRNNSGDKHLTQGLLGPNLTTQSSTPMLGSNQTPCSKKPRLLRPLLPRERSIIDKVLDALVGDGPDKRFALICNECSSHNGMALQEEFEYLAFRCCYCNHFNPARRTRLKTELSTENIENTNDLTNNSKTTPYFQSTKSNVKRMKEGIKSSKNSLYSHDSDNDSVLGNETVVCNPHEILANEFNEQSNLKDDGNVDTFKETTE